MRRFAFYKGGGYCLRLGFIFSLLTGGLLLGAFQGSAASVVTIDEYGNGTLNGAALAFSLSPDPGPGGLPNTLTYSIPFTGVSGDVELLSSVTGIPVDVIRFNGNGTIIFYSSDPGTLASQPHPPFPVPNTVTTLDNGTFPNDMASYLPTAGQPGYDSSAPSYTFVTGRTTTATPEPASMALLLLAGPLFAFFRLRKFRRCS